MNSPIYQAAESFAKEAKSLDQLMHVMQRFIVDHAHSMPEQYRPKSIIESRFTPPEEAYKKGIMSCGAMANIVAAMLRHIGYKVKLIHGEWEKSVDHSWISVYDKSKDVWMEYDLTTHDMKLRPGHKKKAEVDSWEEIKDQIIKDHETLKERRIEKGFNKEK